MEVVRNFGVWFDLDFAFSRHIRNTCKALFAHIRDLKQIRGTPACVMLFFWQQMLWLEVVVTTPIPYLEVWLLLIFTSSSVSRKVLLELFPIPINTRRSILSERLFTGCILSIALFFKTALLVYKFLQSSYPKYLSYKTCTCESDGVLLPTFTYILETVRCIKLILGRDIG